MQYKGGIWTDLSTVKIKIIEQTKYDGVIYRMPILAVVLPGRRSDRWRFRPPSLEDIKRDIETIFHG